MRMLWVIAALSLPVLVAGITAHEDPFGADSLALPQDFRFVPLDGAPPAEAWDVTAAPLPPSAEDAGGL